MKRRLLIATTMSLSLVLGVGGTALAHDTNPKNDKGSLVGNCLSSAAQEGVLGQVASTAAKAGQAGTLVSTLTKAPHGPCTL